jgi:Restriction endonuclease PvuII
VHKTGVNWIFAVYEGIELIEIYKLTSLQLEPYYKKWVQKWHNDGKKDINNPKIPLLYVKENGELLFRRND